MFINMLGYVVRRGSLCVIDATGRRHFVGDGSAPAATIRLTSRKLNVTLAFTPSLSIGEAFMDGSLIVEDGNLYSFLEILALNADRINTHPWLGLLAKVSSRIAQRNPIGRARLNVSHHYDLPDELYDLFLDADRQYSCAYFLAENDTLEIAQENKKRHIASKLMLDRPNLRVLDIGSGWGGLGLYLAEQAGAVVTGVTLSTEQHKVSVGRAAQSEFTDKVDFALRDYREQQGKFDRIVSVGMFEHVGKKNYTEFFAKIHELLLDDGVALIHAIGDSSVPGPINPFIRRHIFPGADTPSLSEVFPIIERSGLVVTDVEILRLHYAYTLRIWRGRFMARRPEAVTMLGERFCRMWEFYLTLCEIGFRHRSNIVFQIQLTKRNDTLPITRDWMTNWERSSFGSQTGGASALGDALIE